MRFRLTTNAEHYTKEEAARLKRFGFRFEEVEGLKPFRKLSKPEVFVEVYDLPALMGLIEQLGTVAVQGPSSSTTDYSLYRPGDHRAPLSVEPQINVLDDYD